jgi:hypothetical protein
MTKQTKINSDRLAALFPPRIDEAIMIRTEEACKALGIKPRVLLNEIHDLQNIVMGAELRKQPTPRIKLGLVEIDPDAIGQLAESHLTPTALRLLIELRDKGALPTARRTLDPVPENLLAYAARNEAELLAESERLKEQRRQQKESEDEALKRKLDNLDAINEPEFTWSLLNQLFWHHQGKGQDTLTIGGLKVTKSLTPYASNSGKTRDFSVTFSWTARDGTACGLSRESRFADNRRNDAERNWGLPE